MKRIELDRVFTAKVNEYIMRGYTISTESMRGSQGETAKVDLIKGDELIRVWMNKEYAHYDRASKWHGDMMVVRVSRWKEYAHLAGTKTVWMNDLEHLEEIVYYKVWTYRNEWYVATIEEAQAILDIQHQRYAKKNYMRDTLTDVTCPKAQEIARRYLISHGHYQRVSTDQIRVLREVNKHSRYNRYRIQYRGNNYYLN